MTNETDGPMAIHGKRRPAPTRRRRAYVATSVVLSMLVTGTAFLPATLMNTSLRDHVLGSAVNTDLLMATCENATGGWLAPLAFRNVRVSDRDGRIVCTVEELRTSRGLLSFLTDSSQIGLITLVGPRVEIHIGDDGQWPYGGKRSPSNSQLSFAIEDGSFRVTVPWRELPVVDLDDLQISGKIGPDETGQRILTVDGTQILDHQSLSEAHTRQNLALIAPVLSQSTQVSGTASAWIDEIQIPLDSTEEIAAPIRGRVEFHSLEARLTQNWTRQLTALTGQLTGTEFPDRVEVLKDSKVEFAVSRDGIFHDSMVFLLPEFAEEMRFESSGLIHLDASLDLRLTITMPKIAVAGGTVLALLAQFSNEPLQFQIGGTVSKPQLQIPEGSTLLGEISKRVAPAQYQEDAPTLPSAISDLLQNAGNADRDEAGKNLPGNILNLIRSIEQSKKAKGERPGKRKRR